MLNRRELVMASTALPFATAAYAQANPFAVLESQHGGHLGVAALDTGSGKRLAHRADERFAMCSTFKLLAVAAVLRRVDEGSEKLTRLMPYSKADLLPYAPITRAHVGEGHMALGALCEAAIEWSDNTAANLVLASLGGPSAVTQYARSIGDPVTRLDRIEPALNDVKPGDIRDTTTPAAMLADMQKVVLGDALSKASRALIVDWLLKSQTGKQRLRAGFPKNWKVGDKTGSSGAGQTNDIVVAWPPGRAPIAIAAYFDGSHAYPESREAVLAEVGRIVAKVFAP
ncbi:MAG TPA: class A beta-lactamase [Rhizomicrobium sp.]|jgi:beta-lactamase class A|nr:class A beta-lactamase [Rhizomicrobium sp.]